MDPETHEIVLMGSDGEELATLTLDEDEFAIAQEEAFRMYYTALILKACNVVDEAIDKIKTNIVDIAAVTEDTWPEVNEMLTNIDDAVGDLNIVLRHYRNKNPN